jgi:hypothetical protein
MTNRALIEQCKYNASTELCVVLAERLAEAEAEQMDNSELRHLSDRARDAVNALAEHLG